MCIRDRPNSVDTTNQGYVASEEEMELVVVREPNNTFIANDILFQ